MCVRKLPMAIPSLDSLAMFAAYISTFKGARCCFLARRTTLEVVDDCFFVFKQMSVDSPKNNPRDAGITMLRALSLTSGDLGIATAEQTMLRRLPMRRQ